MFLSFINQLMPYQARFPMPDEPPRQDAPIPMPGCMGKTLIQSQIERFVLSCRKADNTMACSPGCRSGQFANQRHTQSLNFQGIRGDAPGSGCVK
ncbi:hypothetical protein [Paraburkholderia sp. BR10882]|uniref:hypothetical protein n=1 Tax=unclassified Paraburkholderia TaxID=2615204 RepID=UPI0034CDF432